VPTGVYFRTEEHKNKISSKLKGKIPTNFSLLQSRTPFVKGHKQLNTGKTHFQKGFTPWNKGKKVPAISGENAYQWKGGTYDRDRKTDMGRKNYRVWRIAVFERDNYMCILCGSTDKLNADHLKPYSLFPELRYAIDNGRTLCEGCHKTTDSYGGKIRINYD
jgi:hypothetical protein